MCQQNNLSWKHYLYLGVSSGQMRKYTNCGASWIHHLTQQNSTLVTVHVLTGDCSVESHISQLDDLLDHSSAMSPAVDDLVTVLYPPVNITTVRVSAVKLANTIKALLGFARYAVAKYPFIVTWVHVYCEQTIFALF